MKFNLIAAALVAGLYIVHADGNSTDATAQFSGINHVQNDLKNFTNQQLEKSFDFLLLAFTFDKYDLNRPGFEKLYRKISDKAWEDTIDLVKYQSKRGLIVRLDGVEEKIINKLQPGKAGIKGLLESNEKDSLKFALDYEIKLAEGSHQIHRNISHAHLHGHEYDPDVAHYLDEKIIKDQSGTIRKLSGHIHNLHSILGESNTKDLGLHLFDDYLDSVE